MKNNHLGFTLIEMLIVITIIGIVAVIAVPAFINQIKNMEAKTNATYIKTFLNGAKQDATIYQTVLTVCLANQAKKCVTSQGSQLISFTDKNNNHHFDKDIDILRSSVFLMQKHGDVQLRAALNKPYIDFKPHNGSPIGHMGHIRYCPKDMREANMFKVSFSKTGIIKLKRHQDEKTGC